MSGDCMGDKVKTIISKYITINDMYEEKEVKLAFKQIDQLIEKSNRVDSLEKENEKVKNLVNKYMPMSFSQLETFIEDAELGRALDWYYTDCETFYAITGGRLSKKRKWEMLKERILIDYREEKEGK